jgi:hypothetical protein
MPCYGASVLPSETALSPSVSVAPLNNVPNQSRSPVLLARLRMPERMSLRPSPRPTNQHPQMSLDPEQLQERIVALEIEHRDLDEAIVRLADLPNRDDLLLTRLKKRKLQLKDQILQLKMLLVPDIPA